MVRRLLAALIFCLGCEGQVQPPIHEEGDPNEPDGGIGLVPIVDDSTMDMGGPSMLAPGGYGRVTAGNLNLRDAVGTTANILTVMPCGSRVKILGGPSSGWWNVQYMTQTGWASGKYLVPEALFDVSICGGSDGGVDLSVPPAVDAGGGTVASIFALAQLAVGYSYYWGHGSWRDDHTLLGACSGTCPSCTHTGQYGADCSGFVAKVWQVPAASPITTDTHPFSTYNFYNEQVYWKQVPRSTLQPADALVHRTATSGHIALFESGSDPFGNVWLYEARGCATGVVHNLRTVDTTYIAIRKNGL
jgi:uncharacterized protein YraI